MQRWLATEVALGSASSDCPRVLAHSASQSPCLCAGFLPLDGRKCASVGEWRSAVVCAPCPPPPDPAARHRGRGRWRAGSGVAGGSGATRAATAIGSGRWGSGPHQFAGPQVIRGNGCAHQGQYNARNDVMLLFHGRMVVGRGKCWLCQRWVEGNSLGGGGTLLAAIPLLGGVGVGACLCHARCLQIVEDKRGGVAGSCPRSHAFGVGKRDNPGLIHGK